MLRSEDMKADEVTRLRMSLAHHKQVLAQEHDWRAHSEIRAMRLEVKLLREIQEHRRLKDYVGWVRKKADKSESRANNLAMQVDLLTTKRKSEHEEVMQLVDTLAKAVLVSYGVDDEE